MKDNTVLQGVRCVLLLDYELGS